MKKFTQLSLFLLSFMLVSLFSLNAQTWEFKNFTITNASANGKTDTFEADGVAMTVSGKFASENSKPITPTIDGITYESGTGIYGDGDSSSGGTTVPTRRYLSFPVTGEGIVTVIAAARAAGVSYDVMHVDANSAITSLGSASFTAKSDGSSTNFPVGGAGTIYIYYKTSSKNVVFYSVSFASESSEEPTLKLTSGSAIQEVQQGSPMDNIVYTWGGTADSAVISWGDTGKPSNIDATINTENKTLTIGGTIANDASIETYTYEVKSVAQDGSTYSEIQAGSITVTEYQVSAPVITSPSNKDQSVIAGKNIAEIEFTYEQATKLEVVFSPETDVFTVTPADGKIIISGTAPVQQSYPFEYTYTVTATPLEGYNGETISAEGTIKILNPDFKSVAFVTTRSSDGVDTINFYNRLKDHYNMFAIQASSSMDFTDYDLVIADEVLDGKGQFQNMKAAFTKPFLNMKSFFYTTTDRWGWGVPDNGAPNSNYVTVVEPGHPIFDGITIDSCNLVIIDGKAPAKSVQGTTISFGHNLAQVAKEKTEGSVVSFHEVEAGSTYQGIEVLHKYMLLSISSTAFNNLNDNGIKIIMNACDYLLGDKTFGAEGDAGCGTKFDKMEISNIQANSETGVLKWDVVPAAAKYWLTITETDGLRTAYSEPIAVTTNEYTFPAAGSYSVDIEAENVNGDKTQVATQSFTIYSVTGIDNEIATKNIVSVKYYNTVGIEVSNNTTGIVIVKTTYEDGSVSTEKIIK